MSKLDNGTTIRLACPSCRRSLKFVSNAAQCGRCGIAIPVYDGFPVWSERLIDPDEARARAREIGDDRDRYTSLLERRFERKLYEPYAWFRPFNESTRALEPFRDLLTSSVEPGLPILDLWCRTGWTGEMLASWFPENPVVSLWEGDNDHLGYHGYAHWLPAGERAENLSIVFAHPGEALPFPDDHFALIHGLDTLHRYPSSPLIGECLRIAIDLAPIMFPHVHLTNSEPEPFFERGCTQLHGTTWGAYLDRVCKDTGRRAWVLSERDMYLDDDARPLADDRTTTHYNGFIAIGPQEWDGALLTRRTPSVDGDAYLFSNPLLSIDTATGQASVDAGALSGTVGYMSDRHPVAIEALTSTTERTLSSFECQVLLYASAPITVAELAAQLEVSAPALVEQCAGLICDKALQIEAVSPAMARLQAHYRSLRPERSADFATLWQALPERYGERPILRGADGSLFDVGDVDALVQATRHWLFGAGLRAGDRLGLVGEQHVEYLVTVWAAWLSGLIVVPLSPELPPSLISHAIDAAEVAAIVCDEANRTTIEQLAPDLPRLVFDIDDPASGTDYFADVVAPLLDEPPLLTAEVATTAVAAFVFTSGSTGPPKGVRLRMSSLLHTGAVMGTVLGLGHGDQLLSLAPAHTMSGLRNPFVTALLAGTTVVVDTACHESTIAVAEACRRYGITVLAASPTLVDRLADLGDRIHPKALRSVRTIATTADRVDHQTAAVVEQHFDVTIVDYYGLTETGGIVVAAAPGCIGALGKPIGAVVEVHVDGERAPIETTGEIRVSGPSLMAGYLGETVGVRHENGWVYTGDRAVAHTDGSFSLLGRVNEQIKRRNGEIYPLERVLDELNGHDRITSATVAVDSASRQLDLEVIGDGNLDAAQVREWIQDACGTEGLPDRLHINPARG